MSKQSTFQKMLTKAARKKRSYEERRASREKEYGALDKKYQMYVTMGMCKAEPKKPSRQTNLGEF